MTPSRIALVSSELAPFAKTGGLADVAAGLSRYLRGAGHDVRIFLPLYRRVREGGWPLEPSPLVQGVELAFGSRTVSFSVFTTPLPTSDGTVTKTAPQVHLVDCPALYDRPGLYTQDEDEPLRFALLTLAAIESCQRMQWAPDVFHVNDWHTGLLPLYLKTAYAWDRLFAATRTLLTIHNIGYQGVFGTGVLEELRLMDQRQHLDQEDLRQGRVNFLKTGLLHADALTTVSRRYAEEIQTPEFGMGLEGILQRRRDVLHGIVNGMDYGDWNPATDTLISHPYGPDDLSGKLRNKQALLEGFDLAFDERAPVLGIVSRLTHQKGFELLPDVLPVLLRAEDVRVVVLGSGEASHEQYFQWLRDTWPEKVGIFRGYDDALAHRIEAGADMFLMPSRYEPCGLNQMYSLKYGTVPVVRRTGGLADTVEPFDPATGEGTGFLFEAFAPEALYATLREALGVWRQPDTWARLVQNGMAQDFSWERQGPHYEALYESLTASTG
jgi:starch synthase